VQLETMIGIAALLVGAGVAWLCFAAGVYFFTRTGREGMRIARMEEEQRRPPRETEFRPSNRATTTRRSFFGERWPLSREVGTDKFYAARDHGRSDSRAQLSASQPSRSQ
jgi:hypothetical protein